MAGKGNASVVTVTVSEDRIVDAMVSAIMTSGSWRDGSEDTSAFARAIEKRIQDRVKSAVDAAMKDFTTEKIRRLVEPLPWQVRFAQETFQKLLKEAIEAEMKVVREKIRAAVDERLSGAVVATLREAVGLAK